MVVADTCRRLISGCNGADAQRLPSVFGLTYKSEPDKPWFRGYSPALGMQGPKTWRTPSNRVSRRFEGVHDDPDVSGSKEAFPRASRLFRMRSRSRPYDAHRAARHLKHPCYRGLLLFHTPNLAMSSL